MRKFIYVLMLILCAGFTSCGGSDDEKGGGSSDLSKMVGTWECTASHDEWSTDKSSGSIDGVFIGEQLTINADGTFTSTSSSFGLKGTWSVTGNSFTAKNTDGRVMSGTQKINGNSLRIQGSTTDGYSFDYSFIKK